MEKQFFCFTKAMGIGDSYSLRVLTLRPLIAPACLPSPVSVLSQKLGELMPLSD